MSVVKDIFRTYRTPRQVLRVRIGAEPREDRGIAILLAGCFLMFISQCPWLARLAMEDPTISREHRIGAALFGWMFLMPLVFYAVAGVSHLIARLFGGAGSWFGARMALFWALLASSPLWLLNGLVLGFIGAGIESRLVGTLALVCFLVFWAFGLREAEGREEGAVI